MSRVGTGFGLYWIALLLLIVSTSLLALAQDAETDGGENTSAVLARPLDRRTKMLAHPLKKDEDASWEGVVSLEQNGLGVFDAFFSSLSMIIVSEIGDETFIIAALMAMRHPKSIVLSGALSALVVMTVLSTGLGRIVPNLISRKHTNSAATVLYAFFGLRLLYIAWRSGPKASQKKEIEEVEEKLESGQGKSTLRRFFTRFCTPIFLESFILTFLAEWGDRSQIATIALSPAPPMASPSHPDIERVLWTEDDILGRVAELASQISIDCEGGSSSPPLVVVGVATGAFLFLADIVRRISLPLRVDFVRVESYGSGTESNGAPRISSDLKLDVEGSRVLVVEDIVDTGHTLSALIAHLRSKGAVSVSVCTFLDKPARRKVRLELVGEGKFYRGFECPDFFVVGYGMDYNELYRNLPYVGVLKPKLYA